MLHRNINPTKELDQLEGVERVVEERVLGSKYVDVIWLLFLSRRLFSEDQRDWTTSSNFINSSTLKSEDD
jgi:hypothetical protein